MSQRASESAPSRIWTAELEEAISPRRPHDDLSFDELARRYNAFLTSDRRRVFARLIIQEAATARRVNNGAPVRALDVGCGRGIGRQLVYTEAIGAHIDEFWGVEPDTSVQPRPGLFDHFQHATLEDADLPDNYFDIVYSFMVMEHVADPLSFWRAASQCLKPGGVHIFMTPNAQHYFTMTARLLHKLRLDEFILRMITSGRQEEYHYPVQYKCNSRGAIRRCAAATGFDPPSFVFLESDGPTGYLKGPFVVLYKLLKLRRRVIRHKGSLLTLTARAVKSSARP